MATDWGRADKQNIFLLNISQTMETLNIIYVQLKF